jgi:predicted PurR-regulated permease PerM
MKMEQWLGIIVLMVSLCVLWQIRQLLLLAFTAIVLATAINQLVRRFQRSGLKRSRAILLSVVLVGAVLVVIVLLVIPPFIEQFQDLIELLPAGLERIQEGVNWLEEQVGPNLPELPDLRGVIDQLQPLSANFVQQPSS